MKFSILRRPFTYVSIITRIGIYALVRQRGGDYRLFNYIFKLFNEAIRSHKNNFDRLSGVIRVLNLPEVIGAFGLTAPLIDFIISVISELLMEYHSRDGDLGVTESDLTLLVKEGIE